MISETRTLLVSTASQQLIKYEQMQNTTHAAMGQLGHALHAYVIY